MTTEAKSKYAFMFANWYSGATLFAILLNNHRQLTCNGETFPSVPDDLMKYRCSCGLDLMTCDFYRSAAGHMLHNTHEPECRRLFAVLPEFSRIRMLDRWFKGVNHLPRLRDIAISAISPCAATARTFVDAHQTFYSQSCLYERSSVYIDGTKSLRRAELFARYSNQPFRVLYLIRDGRGFCRSFLRSRKLRTKRVPRAAAAWMEHIRLVDRFAARYPHIQIKTIRYEDLARDPETVLRQTCEYLGVQYDSTILQEKTGTYHVLGNVMRKKFDWHIQEDLSWKTVFTSDEIDTMNQLMRPQLTRFGYLN